MPDWTKRTRPSPLIVLVHGNHGSCDAGQDTANDTCAQFKHNEDGYAYLAENLATWGYTTFSLSQDQLRMRQDNNKGKGMHNRRVLIAATLDAITAASRARGLPVDAHTTIGKALAGRLDMSRIGLMGHSRGGDAVANFLSYNRVRTDGPRYPIRGVISLAPTDYERSAPRGMPYMTILPMCDGDVSNLQGARLFERSQYADPGDEYPRIQVEQLGAIHNWYNTVWYADGGADGQANNDRKQCPNAGFTSIQAAVDYASPWDTIVVCAGVYQESSVPSNSASSPVQAGARNGLTINKPLTIRGAGAGKVTIEPDQSLPTLAGDQPYLRDGGGNVITVSRQSLGSTHTSEMFVDISGVTVTAGKVWAEAGIAYFGAAGRIADTVVGPLKVAADAAELAAHPHGWGVVKTGVIQGSGPNTVESELTVADSMVTGYQSGGILFDGARGPDGSPDNTVRTGIRYHGYVSGTVVKGSHAPQAGVEYTSGVTGAVGDSRITGNRNDILLSDAGPVTVTKPRPSAPTGAGRVADAAPTAEPADPAPGSVVHAGTAVHPLIRATDDFAIASATLIVNGARASTATVAPYQFSWTPSAKDAGTRVTLQARVVDSSGNTRLSRPVTVKVARS